MGIIRRLVFHSIEMDILTSRPGVILMCLTSGLSYPVIGLQTSPAPTAPLGWIVLPMGTRGIIIKMRDSCS